MILMVERDMVSLPHWKVWLLKLLWYFHLWYFKGHIVDPPIVSTNNAWSDDYNCGKRVIYCSYYRKVVPFNDIYILLNLVLQMILLVYLLD